MGSKVQTYDLRDCEQYQNVLKIESQILDRGAIRIGSVTTLKKNTIVADELSDESLTDEEIDEY